METCKMFRLNTSKIKVSALVLFLVSPVVVLGFVRAALAEGGNSEVTAMKLDGGFKIYLEDQDGISGWIVYQSGGGSMEVTCQAPYPKTASSDLLFMAETDFPLRVEVEDSNSDVDWWKVYSDMVAQGPFRDPECTEPYKIPSQLIQCGYGSAPDVDGVINSTEWQDATSLNIGVTTPMDEIQFIATFYAKHDDATLYLAMYLPDTTLDYEDYVEICFDPNNDKSTDNLPDDLGYWLYRNDVPFQFLPEGTMPPYGFTYQMTNDSQKWQFEFALSYSELGITAGESKTMGFAFTIFDNPAGPPLDIGTGAFPLVYQYDTPEDYGNISSEVQWIPEFPAFLISTIFVTITSLSILAKRKKQIT